MIIWFGIYPSSERLKTPGGLVVLFTSSVHLRDDLFQVRKPFSQSSVHLFNEIIIVTWTILLAILSNFDNKCRFKEFPPLLFFVPDQAVAPLALPEMKTCDQHEPWCSSCNNKKGCLHLTAESGFQMFKSLSEKMVCVLWSLFFDTLGQKISLLRSLLIFIFVFYSGWCVQELQILGNSI